MKNFRYIVILLLLVASTNSFGQIIPRMGIKGGLNSANISGIDGSNIQDFHAGAFMNMKLIFLGIQLEALYSRMGSEVGGERIKNDYLQFPLIGKLFIIPGLLNLQGGIQYSLLVNSVFAGTDIKTAFSGGDWGVPIGLELEVLNRLQITARYIFGLSDIKGADAGSIPGIGNDELTNELFQLSLGWKFGGK